MAPPEGVTPDLVNPPNNNALAHGVMATCIAVSTFCIILRFYLAVLSRRVKVVECMSDSPTPFTLSVSVSSVPASVAWTKLLLTASDLQA